MKKWLFCFVLLVSLNGFAQERIYFDWAFKNLMQNGCNYADITYDSDNWKLEYYNCIGNLTMIRHYSSRTILTNDNLNGLSIVYNYDGSIYSQGNFVNGIKEGIWLNISRDGDSIYSNYTNDRCTKSVSINANNDTSEIIYYTLINKINYKMSTKFFKKGKPFSIIYCSHSGKDSILHFFEKNKDSIILPIDNSNNIIISDFVPTFAEKMPFFKGGNDALITFLNNNLDYPISLYKANQTGIVLLLFIIDQKGEVENIIINGPNQLPQFEEEAIRVLKLTSGRWKPGKQNNEPIKVRCQLPIEFMIN